MKENENMDYNQMCDVLKRIEDSTISDDVKLKVLKNLASPQLTTTNYLTKDDYKRGMHWLIKYYDFKVVSDAVKYYTLHSRYKHLIESPYIRSFDQVNHITGEYVRDIKEAGAVSADVVNSITGLIPTICETITSILNRPDFIDAVVNTVMENPKKFSGGGNKHGKH